MNEESEKPPLNQNILDTWSRILPSFSALLRRLAGIRTVWSDDWYLPPIGGFIPFRCLAVFMPVWEE